MKTRVLLSGAGLLAILASAAMAQTQQQDSQQQHPAGSPPQTQAAPPSSAAPQAAPPAAGQGQMPMGQMPMGQMMQGMPEQCRAMMQNMPPNCMAMMQQMMQQMMQGRMGAMPGTQAQPASQSAATKAYMEAIDRMHGPMAEGIRASDPDVAFVRGMIAHHQGAIDMAKVVLQHGKDDQAKKWANDALREQQREMQEMEAWLKTHAR